MPEEAAGPSGRSLKFIDKDEHVYFWFPLLAGLSELTFDPRCAQCRGAAGARGARAAVLALAAAGLS